MDGEIRPDHFNESFKDSNLSVSGEIDKFTLGPKKNCMGCFFDLAIAYDMTYGLPGIEPAIHTSQIGLKHQIPWQNDPLRAAGLIL